MRILLIIFAFLSLTANSQSRYYMATTGNDTNPGTFESPRKTIESAITLLSAGDTLSIRGGTYRSEKLTSVVNRFEINNKNGSVGDSIYILAYPGETVIFNCDEQLIPGSAGDGPVAMKFINCSYLKVKGIRITGLNQNPTNINTPLGLGFSNVDRCNFEQVEVDNIQGYGWYFQDGSSDNYIKNCDVHHIADSVSGWGGANGFNITGGDGSTDNTFDGCRAWWCSDDGFDLFGTNTRATFINCWAFLNGYRPGTLTTAGDGQGFKLGPAASDQSATILRWVYGCISAKNRVNGFDQNSQSNTTCRYIFYNNTGIDNGSNGYFFGANTGTVQTFKNNLNYNNGIWGDEIQSGANIEDNSWNGGVTVTSGDFQSTDYTQLYGARQADGSLPAITYARPVAESDLINACTTDYGYGKDMGALQYSSSPPPSNPPSGIKATIRGRKRIFSYQ